ncbi:predicted protein [Pyrenophora tritici-repentis Pt-1C-BFP]|uniref:Uncharacterized protein n=1 Tax=Pyrenophora tritici-repentis (strain Pt-1C-BFP) TaxID=426418 RepID=B2VV97_PYRTR|nr:uncharacterized protein PTRG_01164 [Pyrenophora tritici-repentis Pt-1C-BFP]EDU40602.1 predicted protein [Pyrenophora tritici-repentis Pt-1C-BFP]
MSSPSTISTLSTPSASATPEATETPQGSPHRSEDAYAQLPFYRVVWQHQTEIELAQPLAMKYGKVFESKIDVWIYLTKTTRTLIFHSYHPDGEPDGVHVVDELLDKAKPCFAFKLAKTPMEILALAIYYFMKKGLTENYDLALTPHQADLLTAMCRGKRRSKIVVLKAESTPTPPPEGHPIDRYLHLEDEEKELSEDLKHYNCRVMEMRRRVIEAQALLKKEEKEAAKVVDHKDKSEAEKKRLWDTMSKEDVQELGRRDSERTEMSTSKSSWLDSYRLQITDHSLGRATLDLLVDISANERD